MLLRKIRKIITGSIDKFINDDFYLSNYYEIPITYNGLVFQSSEAIYQSSKNYSHVDLFTTLTPDEAKHLGKVIPIRSDWEDIKDSVMYDILTAKFNQNNDLKEKLISTFPKYLEEGNTWNDRYWGTCHNVGSNKLGKLLMKLRFKFILQKIF